MEALKEKYLSLEDDIIHGEYDAAKDRGEVYFGGNRNLKVETVGFEKIQRKQRQVVIVITEALRD